VEEYADQLEIVPVRLGRQGIAKQIFLGAREAEVEVDYLKSFIELARQSTA
jgi:LysR family transcriptional regulator for metE and metH